ncbi:hypothetical protein [Fusobacterium ulcerans]|uniref:hypothetical protein n=1 Tax=Fusobacterium ulcerans TaxID=861 RepID=UPI002E798EFE|nr:hypothetical protein [Fusobacterium ulcerans]MEE0139037.1 hypothetical protein [Fusobacterium ulcerans]
MIYLYDENLILCDVLPYTMEELEGKKIKLKDIYKKFEYFSEERIDYPKIKNGKIVSKTKEELKIEGITPLAEGEYIEAGKIIVVEAPKNLIKKVWNKEMHIWEEGATREELIEERKNKIVVYEKLEEEKKLLEGSKFSTEDEIKAITEKMAILEGYINTLSDKIKLL